MSSNKEWFDSFRKISDFSGGSGFGLTFDGEAKIADTRFGEFVYEISEEGELVVEFPNNGLGVVYDNDGNLERVSLDVVDYFGGFTLANLAKMPNEGTDILQVIRALDEQETTVAMEVNVKDGSSVMVVVDGDDNEERFPCEYNFYQGATGVVMVGGVNLVICVEKTNDEFVIGMGEISKKVENKGSVRLLTVSNRVDYIDEVLSDNPRDLRNLAERILLT